MTRRNVLRCDREHRAARTWARFMGIMRAMVWLAAPALAYFVHASAGADTNDGRAPSTAFRTIARALQAAQLKLLADRRYRHPCYWAPYLIIGNWL